jgi:putative SOS response-associated peptidase YedK
MCGRYASSRKPEDLVEAFEIDFLSGEGPGRDVTVPVAGAAKGAKEPKEPKEGTEPTGDTAGKALGDAAAYPARTPGDANYNVAPTTVQPVVLERLPRTAGDADEPDADGDTPPEPEPVRWLRGLTWGLVPSWAKDPSTGARMINARAESLFEKPAFRRAATARRCLVPADGWYEWQKSPTETDAKGKPRKQPFWMQPADGGGLAFAGLYELWRDKERDADDPGAWLATYTIVTTAAEPGLDVIHERMPFVMPPERWDRWLDPELQDPDTVRALLVPPEPGRFSATAISTRVNNVRNNGPELLEPLGIEELRGVVDPATGELIGAGDQPLF